jgi:hypothetical protein
MIAPEKFKICRFNTASQVRQARIIHAYSNVMDSLANKMLHCISQRRTLFRIVKNNKQPIV